MACSTDSVFTLNEFSKQTKFGWNAVSDWNGEIAPKYDSLQTLGNGMKAVAKRTVFIIDRTGTIRYTWQSEGGALPDNQELLKAIREL